MANTKLVLDRQAQGKNFTFGSSSAGQEANVVFEKGTQAATQVVLETKGTIKINTLSGVLKASTGTVSGGATTTDLTEGTNLYYTDARVRLNRLDQMAAPTAAVSMNSQKITNLDTPSAASDAATKGYVDAIKQALDIKDSVRATTTANGTLASDFENGDVIDGVTLATGDRILIKDQSTGSQNGIYVVNASGAPTRATDADASSEVTAGMFVFVEEGTVHGNDGFVLTTDGPITLGTTALTFTQFSGAGQFVGGQGISISGNEISVNTDDSTIEVNSNALRIVPGGVTNSQIADDTIDLAAKVTGVLPEVNGGTGESTYTDGQLLIGNSSGNGLTKATLTEGTGISITNGNGSITIATTGSAGYQRATTVSGTQDGSNKTFTIGNAVSAGSEQVFLNGQLLTPGATNDYEISGTTVTFQGAIDAPAATDVIRVYGTY